MPKSAAAIEQQIREWKSSDIAPRRLLKHLPPPLGPSLRTYDSTESWNPQFHWPSTPVPDDSASQQAENTADLITSDDPWYLDAAVKLVIEKIHPRFSDRFPEYETVYAMLKNCSDTRLPLELFALGINLMKALARKEDWVREWMSSRPEPVEIHPYDDSMPHGDNIPSSGGTYLPSYFRAPNETPPPPTELFILASLACANAYLAASRHPLGRNYEFRPSIDWAMLVSRGRFGANQVRAAYQVVRRACNEMTHEEFWGKLSTRMDQIERHAARTMKAEAIEAIEGEYSGWPQGLPYDAPEQDLNAPRLYQGTGQDWADDDDMSGLNHNLKIGSEETRSVTVYGWLKSVY